MDRSKQREIAKAVRPGVYASTSVDSKEIEREELQSDIDKFLANGGTIEKIGVIINGPEGKKTREQVRNDFRGSMLKKREAELARQRGKNGEDTT